MHNRIELLKTIKEAGQNLANVQADICKTSAMMRCIDIEEMKAKIDAADDDKKRIENEQEILQKKAEEISRKREQINNEYIQVSADLKASDLGSKRQQLSELSRSSEMLSDNNRQWQKVLGGLSEWEENEAVTDYVSNTILNLIDDIRDGSITEDKCRELHVKLESVKQNIENEIEDYNEQKNTISRELKEKKQLVEDMKNNRKVKIGKSGAPEKPF